MTRGGGSVPGGATLGVRYPMRPAARVSPVVLAWRWRYEAAVIASASTVVAMLLCTLGVAWLVCTLSALAGVVSVAPGLRRLIVRRAWCVITAHRVRTGCAQACIRSASGKLPVLLLTSASPAGQRVLIWCRAGTCAADFAQSAGLLAAACWASEVRVSPDLRRPYLVWLDIIRR